MEQSPSWEANSRSASQEIPRFFTEHEGPPLVSILRQFKSCPCASLTEHHAMKAYLVSEGIAPRILDLDTRWRWMVRQRPDRFTPREKALGTQIGGWVGPTAGLDTVVNRKIPSPAGIRTPDHPARSRALYRWDTI
jgi:hypothetical protein